LFLCTHNARTFIRSFVSFLSLLHHCASPPFRPSLRIALRARAEIVGRDSDKDKDNTKDDKWKGHDGAADWDRDWEDHDWDYCDYYEDRPDRSCWRYGVPECCRSKPWACPSRVPECDYDERDDHHDDYDFDRGYTWSDKDRNSYYDSEYDEITTAMEYYLKSCPNCCREGYREYGDQWRFYCHDNKNDKEATFYANGRRSKDPS